MTALPAVRGAHLVGSINQPTAAATLRVVAENLGSDLARVPDGEVGELEALLADDEHHDRTPDPRALLGRYFDVSYRHRAVMTFLLRDLGALSETGLVERIVNWRRRLVALLAGPEADVSAQARAIVALGGLGDCLVLLGDTDVETLRTAALDAACAALGPLATR